MAECEVCFFPFQSSNVITILIHKGTIQGIFTIISVSPCNSCSIQKSLNYSYLNLCDSKLFIERFNSLGCFMERGKCLPENPLTRQ